MDSLAHTAPLPASGSRATTPRYGADRLPHARQPGRQVSRPGSRRSGAAWPQLQASSRACGRSRVDGNLHSTFLVDRGDEDELRRAETAAQELFALAARLGGSVSGEHGLGWVKRGRLAQQWAPRALALHEQVKHAFDPKGLLNPGKKLARATTRPPRRIDRYGHDAHA